MDLLCPLSTIRKKNSSTAPWLSDVLRNNRRELRSAERKWKKSKLDTDLISYHMLLSKFSLDVTSAKTSFYKEKLKTSALSPKAPQRLLVTTQPSGSTFSILPDRRRFRHFLHRED
ncbi:hypothetical protein QTP70_010418 [Hemibagrus guttatus]|uniref:Uncharacterized protein n=1 Tax=Hemibagrus guttatus TaxID=175788 RepID=A0AAE0V329_9TELE|nr:hypothetical protein QTP70_010418 [Hemibagrus guttatus]KAK3562933.1 hypothetical protein QTP86_011612 [Hemibagrus guttatus]